MEDIKYLKDYRDYLKKKVEAERKKSRRKPIFSVKDGIDGMVRELSKKQKLVKK